MPWTDEEKRENERLDAAGWKSVSVTEFLGLTPEEEAHIELRLALARTLRERRQAAEMTQKELAEKIGSSQPRIVKVESGHPSVSLDLLIRALIATGATPRDIGQSLTALG